MLPLHLNVKQFCRHCRCYLHFPWHYNVICGVQGWQKTLRVLSLYTVVHPLRNSRLLGGTSMSEPGAISPRCPRRLLKHSLAGPEQPGLTLKLAFFCAGGWTRWPPEVLSSLRPFIVLWLGLKHAFPHFSMLSIQSSYIFLILFLLRKVCTVTKSVTIHCFN